MKSMGILYDTREQKNDHILDYFKKKNIPVKKRKINQGDYSFYIPKNEKLGIPVDLFFDKEFAIERKNSLEELSGNLTTGRDRFKNELAQHKGSLLLLIENANYHDIITGNYNTQYGSASFLGSLHSMSTEFDVPFIFIPDNRVTGVFIERHCYYYLRNLIK